MGKRRDTAEYRYPEDPVKEVGNGYLVSWCVGHLLELSAPERYDERVAKWRQEDLPILSEKWLYEVFPGTRRQHQLLKSLMERSDLESLVCATDAGREGELIFRLVYNQCRCEKPFERLWISSMEDAHAEHLTGQIAEKLLGDGLSA